MVQELAEQAKRDGRFGLDTEFVSERRYRPLLCLVQIVVGDRIEILDPLGDLDAQPLAELLADPEIEVVLHAGRQDVAILKRSWDTEFTNIFDTQVAAGFAGYGAQSGTTRSCARSSASPRRAPRASAAGTGARSRPIRSSTPALTSSTCFR